MALVNTIGLTGAVLGIVGFFQKFIHQGTPDGSTVTVKVGLEKDDDDKNLAGGLHAVYAWDNENNYLGTGKGSFIDHAGVYTTTVDQNVPGARAEFVGVAAGDDAICIAWVTVGMKDATPGGAWTGDIGSNCGHVWYESVERAGPEYTPRCTWLDGDHTADVVDAALKFRTTAYGEKVDDTIKSQSACDATVWGGDTGPINKAPPARRTPVRAIPRPPWMQERLVVSNLTVHRAEDLCSSDTSWGPDFVGSDGMFCDMESKILTPLCTTTYTDSCLSIDEANKNIVKRTNLAKREVEVLYKAYRKVSNWS